MIQREISRVLVLKPLWQSKRCKKHRQDIFVLDRAFALIEGHPLCSSLDEKLGHATRRIVDVLNPLVLAISLEFQVVELVEMGNVPSVPALSSFEKATSRKAREVAHPQLISVDGYRTRVILFS
jgi:hypothetical protein